MATWSLQRLGVAKEWRKECCKVGKPLITLGFQRKLMRLFQICEIEAKFTWWTLPKRLLGDSSHSTATTVFMEPPCHFLHRMVGVNPCISYKMDHPNPTLLQGGYSWSERFQSQQASLGFPGRGMLDGLSSWFPQTQGQTRSSASRCRLVTPGPFIMGWLAWLVCPFQAIIAGWWWLVAIFYFPMTIGNLIIPIDEVIFFRGVALAHQPDRNVW